MRPTLQEFKKEALADPEVSREYHELPPAYRLRKQLIKIRKDAGLTQEELAAGCLGCLILPYIIKATQNGLNSLSPEQRLIGPSLGLSHFQNLVYVLLPQTSKSILSGVILAVGRAAEDTAVILLTGVAANSGLPRGLTDKFEALPFNIYYLASEYRSPEDLQTGFGTCIVLLTLTTGLFIFAHLIQRRLDHLCYNGN